MNTFTITDFEFSFLEEGFSARDTVEQKINEFSQTVSFLCWYMTFVRWGVGCFLHNASHALLYRKTEMPFMFVTWEM